MQIYLNSARLCNRGLLNRPYRNAPSQEAGDVMGAALPAVEKE